MAEQEVENEKNPLEDLVQYSLDQDFNNANKVFNDVISVKLNDVLDQEKIKLANQLYNGQPAEEDDTEGDEDQLELDLDNEEDGGDVSAGQRIALKTKRPKKSPVLMWKSKWQTTSHQTTTPEGTKKTEMKKYLIKIS